MNWFRRSLVNAWHTLLLTIEISELPTKPCVHFIGCTLKQITPRSHHINALPNFTNGLGLIHTYMGIIMSNYWEPIETLKTCLPREHQNAIIGKHFIPERLMLNFPFWPIYIEKRWMKHITSSSIFMSLNNFPTLLHGYLGIFPKCQFIFDDFGLSHMIY